jgi:hypothetical protein
MNGEWLKTLLTNENYKKTVTPDTLIQVARPKSITQEVRNWVVDGKIITSSTYIKYNINGSSI